MAMQSILSLLLVAVVVSGRLLSTGHVSGEEQLFTACVAFQCKNVDSELDGVEVVYVDDLTFGASRLLDRDEMLRAPAKTSPDQMIAIVVDTSIAYGGYPEDLADAAKEMGYDLVIQQEYGDDSWNCGFGATLTATRGCSIPIWRVSQDYVSILSKATTVDLVRDTNPNQQGDLAGSIIFFVVSLVFVVIPLLFVAVLRLIQLGAPFTLNIGIVVCYLSLISVITVVIGNANIMSMAMNGIDFMTYPSYAMLLGVGGAFSLFSVYVIAFRVHLVTLQARGIVIAGIWRDKWVIVLNAVMCYLLIGFIVASYFQGQQSRPTGSVSWYLVVSVQYFIARLLFAIYFSVVHRRLANILHDVEKHKQKQGEFKSTAIVRVFKKLLPLSLLMLVALFCTMCMAVSSVFFRTGGYFAISGLMNSTLIVHLLQVLTITDSKKSSEKNHTQQVISNIAKFINDSVDKIFSCMERNSFQTSKASGHNRVGSGSVSVPFDQQQQSPTNKPKSHHSRAHSTSAGVADIEVQDQKAATQPQAVVKSPESDQTPNV
jgi:hypothetical protein